MRRRLLLVLAVIGAIAIAGFAIPLIEVTSDSRTQQFVLQRESDTSRFAVLADEYVRTGNPDRLTDELDAYHTVYGDQVLVVSTRGVPDYTTGLAADDVREVITAGLRNEPSSSVAHITPWGPTTAMFVEPIGSGAQVNGVVVIEASTAAARADILRSWLIIGAGILAALAGFGAVALGLSRWVLRPLSDLSSAMTDLAGDLPSLPADVDHTAVGDGRHTGGPPEVREVAATFDGLVTTVLRSIEMQRRLIGDASHQLRNPLAALQFRLDIIEPDIPPDVDDDFRMITAEAARLHEILDGLLALATAETPHLSRMSDASVVHSVVADRVDFWAAAARERGARLDYDSGGVDPGLRVAMGETELSQVIDVLIDNATRHAGDTPTVTLALRALDEDLGDGGVTSVELEVADDGPGVDEQDLPRLTQRFFTRDDEHGTGLGLAIVDVLVRAAGGTLDFGRSAAGGLSVRITLTVVPADRRLAAPAGSPT